MTRAAVRALAEVRTTDEGEVGGKAANLGELLASGVRVPDGVVLTAAAGTLSADERGSELLAGTEALGIGPFAVRSSGIGEDSAERSYAGLFETVLDVPRGGVPDAAERVLSSAHSPRATAYQGDGATNGRMAVIVQRMIEPAAAGVALTADPITGDRETCVVTAVRGTADRLVSGQAVGDEWMVGPRKAVPRRQAERSIEARQALKIAAEARRIAAIRGGPQDVEWAIDPSGTLWIIQARPMTALPPDVSWEPPVPGTFTRQLRLGEWIFEPVTPLFESWLLTAMEERMHAEYLRLLGQRAPKPLHVVVNGWYFYSLNWIGPRAMARNLPNIVWHAIRTPRIVAGVLPQTVRHSLALLERQWRDDARPRYLAGVARGDADVETLPVAELPRLIDELADLAGEAFMWVTALTGAAYKMELNLGEFYRRHLRPSLGGSHLPLLVGFEAPRGPDRHAVVSLDWWYAPGQSTAPATIPAADHARLVTARHAAEDAALAALASSPRRAEAFRRLLADAQRLVPIREEQTAELTIAWPAMRRAVVRIGEALAASGRIAQRDDAFFLTRREVLDALADAGTPTTAEVAARRARREEQAKLVPPVLIGRLNPVLKGMVDSYFRMVGAAPSETALVSGSPASPGRATGAVRIVRGPEEFDALQPGEVLVAPLTAPAWTPLFARAVAVVTDVGSPAAHASIIAREYGIPAVVGCVDATARLHDGMRVTVDGATGNVEPA